MGYKRGHSVYSDHKVTAFTLWKQKYKTRKLIGHRQWPTAILLLLFYWLKFLKIRSIYLACSEISVKFYNMMKNHNRDCKQETYRLILHVRKCRFVAAYVIIYIYIYTHSTSFLGGGWGSKIKRGLKTDKLC